MQLAVIEYARNRCGLSLANSTEINPRTTYPVIDLLPEQTTITQKGATMRLGGQDIEIKSDTKAFELFGPVARLRFRHRYEVNPTYIEKLEDAGVVFSGKAPHREIMQIMELPENTFFMATQAHPELTSRLDKPCPFFHEFVKSCVK
jgi:CTP synthase